MNRLSLARRLLASSALAVMPVCGLGAQELRAEEEETILFEADAVSRENENSPIVAEGNVRAYFGERYLNADKLTYFPDTDMVIAEGNVSITDEKRQTTFAGRVQLSGDLRDGVAENFSALLAENARLAADSAVREQGARTRLRNAVYTSCKVCDDDGDAKTPTWRVKALRVTRDEERKVVRFHHAFFELKGIPVLYTPYVQAPDPSVERQSGFLTPLIGASSRLGFNIELPYYLAISNSQDATFFPKYTSNDGILWQGEWRRRGEDSYHVLSGGVIDFDNLSPDENGDIQFDTPGVRWNLFGKGHQKITDNLRVGYDFERVSDDTYLRRYDVRRRGDLRKELDTSDTNRLRSNAFLNWEIGETNVRVDSFLFQDLRTVTLCDLPSGERRSLQGQTNCNSLGSTAIEAAEINDLTPYVLPSIEVTRKFEDIAGGQLYLNGTFASLQRKNGVDTRRMIGSAYWEREHITRGGHRLKAFAELRGDLYRFEDLDEGTEVLGPQTEQDRFQGRFAPSVGVEWSYPLTRRIPGARLFIEPRAQLVASPADQNQNDIINEDSQSVEFDYLSLFDYNKSTGYDAFEDGQRLNAGVAVAAEFDNGLVIDGEIGQQFRLQTTEAFTPQSLGSLAFSSGLGEERSDIVGSLNIKYKNIIGLENRFRIDDDEGRLERAESRAYFNIWRLRGNTSYVRLNEENPVADLARREEINTRLQLKMTDNWSTGFAWREDLLANRQISQDFILAYQDDCALFEVTYRRDRTRDRGLEADNAILFRFTLQSLVD